VHVRRKPANNCGESPETDARVKPVLVGRIAQAAGGRNAIVMAVAVAFLLLLAGISQAAVPVGSDFRISNMGLDSDTSRVALNCSPCGPGIARARDVAYNSHDNEYLVVWYGDGQSTVGDYEIWAQRIDAATGDQIGGDFRISNTGPPNDIAWGAFSPSVAYDSQQNQYLVVWYADRAVGAGPQEDAKHEFEIFGQRLAASGQELGTDDLRISTVGTDGDLLRDGFDPAVAYNSTDDEYLVTWTADQQADGEFEIYGQRLSGIDGSEVGTNDFRISNIGSDGDANRDAGHSAVAYDSTDDQYLVVFDGDGLGSGPSGDDHLEVFGQRISAAGTELGGSTDLQISNAGDLNNTARFADQPTVAYGAQSNAYLVAWEGNPFTQIGETEIFGQRISAVDGTKVGTAGFRISNVGTDNDPSRDGLLPAAAYNIATNQYVVVWQGDELEIDNEWEIFGQLISAAGAEAGGDFRISHVGPDNDPTRGGFVPAIAPLTGADGDLVIWYGDGLAADNKYEIFGHRLGTQTASPPPAVGPTGSSGTPAELRLSVNAKRFQRALKAKSLTLRVTCNVRCTITAATRVSIPGASRTLKLRNVTTTLAASKTTTVRVKLSRAVIRAAKRALKKRRRVTATVNVTARDAAGNRRSVKRSIRIKK
jgi:hypothetical protein